MFEELLIPVEEHKFERLKTRKLDHEWRNRSGEISFYFCYSLGGWCWESNDNAVPKCFGSYDSHVQAAATVFSAIKSKWGQTTLDHFDQRLARVHQARYQLVTHPQYKKACENIGVVVGKSGEWTFDSCQNIYASTILKDISPNSLYFSTKPQILQTAFDYLNNNLHNVYKEYPYEKFKEEKKCVSVHAWWTMFIKPEVDLRNIF